MHSDEFILDKIQALVKTKLLMIQATVTNLFIYYKSLSLSNTIEQWQNSILIYLLIRGKEHMLYDWSSKTL